MGGLTFFAAAAALVVAPPAETSRVQFTAETDVRIDHPVESPRDRTVSTDVGVTTSVFVRQPLVDDEAPLSLQPFLQRASAVSLSITGGATTPALPEPYPFASHREGASAGFNLYLTPWLALTASFGVLAEDDRSANTTGSPSPVISSFLILPASLGIGVRWEDTRFDLTYHVVPIRDDDNDPPAGWIKPYFGNVSVSGYLLSKRRTSISVEVDAIRSGAVASAEIHYYLNRRLSAFAGVWGGRGVVYFNSFFVQNRAGGVIGATGWLSRHLGFSLSYSPSWTSGPTVSFVPLGGATTVGPDTMTHIFSFSLMSRAR